MVGPNQPPVGGGIPDSLLPGLLKLEVLTQNQLDAISANTTLNKNNPVASLAQAGGAPSGAAGGSLSGTYPNPAIAGYIKCVESQVSGTAGGVAPSTGAFFTRTLNTKSNDTASLATLAANHVVLPGGTYIVKASAPAAGVGRHGTRLRDTTNNVTLVVGGGTYAPNLVALSDIVESVSLLSGLFTLAAPANVEVQHFVTNTVGGNDLGVSGSTGENEIFTVLELWKIA